MIRTDTGASALKVLLVEDRDDDAALLLHELDRGGYAVACHRVETRAALVDALRTGTWEIVLSDFSLPSLNALDVLAILHEERSDLPCIVISGTIEEESAVEVLRHGARDFIVKNRMTRLLPAIRRELDEQRQRQRRREAEAKLEETRQRMEFVLDTIGIGTWEIDLKSDVVTHSEVMDRLYGRSPEAPVHHGGEIIDLIHPDDRRLAIDAREAARQGTDSRIEYRVVHPDGSIRWLSILGRVVRDPDGRPTRIVGVGLDITAQKQLEQGLLQAQRMESIGNLAGGIAHDFNNLLTVIKGYSELLLDQFAGDESARSQLTEIQRATESASSLTRQLLAFSRRQILAPRVLNLNDEIRGYHAILRRLIEENVRIELRLDDALAPVNADPGQVEQVLLNLAANARDAMPDGGTVTIATANMEIDETAARRLRGELTPGPHVVLSVSDTGTGMSRSVQERIFEPFFTTKPRGRGTGLGLATVYGIVRQSGGHLAVNSAPGRGTTFQIFLPVARPGDVGVGPERPPTSAELSGTETVLVIEDDERLRRLDERILSRHGYFVLSAGNAAEARGICAEHPGPIHVALIDVIMPGESGGMLGRWMEEHHRDTRIVYMSGYTDDTIAHHGVLEPGTRFLQKPFSPDDLPRAVRQALGD